MQEMKLNDGRTIPAIGFGTWQIQEGEEAYQAVSEALKAGYRHIDTAQIYGNEQSVGQAVKDSALNREDIYLTTKIWNSIHTFDETLTSFEESLEKLQVDYVDLVLIHWPNPKAVREHDGWKQRNQEVWRALETLKEAGKIRSIGVSNFYIHHLEALLEKAEIIPAVNQIRLAPGSAEEELISYCREKDIVLEAYSPLGHGTAFEHETIKEVATHYPGKTPAQIALRWSIDKGFLPLPKSVTPKHIQSNLDIFDFELTKDDIKTLDKVTGVVEPVDPDSKNH